MFNRRFLRVKILQALYAHFQKESTDATLSLKELHHSISRTFDLFLHLLILPTELKSQGEKRMEEASQKAIPTDEDLHPNRRFVDNPVIKAIEESARLTRLCERNKIGWAGQDDAMSRFYKIMRESKAYQTYMNLEDASFRDDKNLLISIYQDLLPKFDLFHETFQERSIYWDEEDFDYASYLALQVVKKLDADVNIDDLVKEAYANKDDREFVDKLFSETLKLNAETEELIMEKASNWDAERIAMLDMLIMKMAISEIVHFRQIPIKVSMNEYIDIAKSFSTPKSGQFINGIVDKVVQELKEQKRVVKVGRGLFEG